MQAAGPILVTGGSGFIGRRLIAKLVSLDVNVISPRSSELDITNLEQTRAFVQAAAPTTVFHLASTARGRTGNKELVDVVTINVMGTANLLSACIENHVSRFIATGTGDEIGSLCSETRGKRVPSSVYGASKLAATDLILAANNYSCLKTTVLRLFAVYGPGQSSQFFIPQLIAAARSRSTLIMTEGHQEREFVWVDDAVEVLLKARVLDETVGLALDVCTGKRHSLRQVVEIVSELSSFDRLASFGAKPYRDTELHGIEADSSTFQAVLGMTLPTSLKEGLEKLLRGEE